MVAGRKPQSPPSSARNLGKSNLGGVIFGCKNTTMKECLSRQIFGLPGQHFTYVKNIDPGLPLFLFNYDDRKLHGIFEAASTGQMNINPYAWTSNGSARTLFPAQVQIRIRLHCQPLTEDQFKPIILDNYFSPNHFWFELDHAQACRLVAKLSAKPTPPSSVGISMFRNLLPMATPPVSCSNLANSQEYNYDQSMESSLIHQVADREAKDIYYMQLKELAEKNLECSEGGCQGEISISTANKKSGEESLLAESSGKSDSNSGISFDSCNHAAIISQLLDGMQGLWAVVEEQTEKLNLAELKMLEAEKEISQLKSRVMILESNSNASMENENGIVTESEDDLHLAFDESIFLVGGYDGTSWLSALSLYSPSQDALKSLKPMSCVRSHSSVVELNGELYVFGGGNGSMWYDTAESYNLEHDEWTLHPSLNQKKGSLAGAALDNKIFALGGGNGVECFSDVEMYDMNLGRWIYTRSMLHKRFAVGAAELNGALYAVGGYDGHDYLQSAERFDPREHSWSRINSMSTKRGCHSLLVMNEKLYALGGYNGSEMTASVEMYEPRMGKWENAEPMKQSRGYSAAAVVNDSIYAIGGVHSGEEDIIQTVECYGEGQGWKMTNLKGVGRRCFCSAIVLAGD